MRVTETKAINPELYGLLKRRFGHVKFAARGQSIDWRLRRREDRLIRKVHRSGEEYRVNCPFCNDTGFRLYVNHMWCVYDEATDSNNLFLVHCWNEECLQDFDARVQLRDIVFESASERQRRGRMPIAAGKAMPTEITEVEPPGPTTRVNELAKKKPNHHAVRYLRGRGFDLDYIADRYHAGYCIHSRWRLAEDRIYIPMRENGLLVGWQARFIGDNLPRDRRGKKLPKYWSCPHMLKAMLAYRMEQAIEHQTIVIVEGPTDVWRFGPQAMALLGKTMSPELLTKFVAAVKRDERLRDETKSIVIALDPKQDDMSRRRGRPHHIDELFNLLREAFPGQVAPVRLPIEHDIGSLRRGYSRSIIREQAAKRGLEISFQQPKVLA